MSGFFKKLWGELNTVVSPVLIYQDGGLKDSQPQNMPGNELETRWVNTLVWGLWRQDLPITNCRLSNGQRLGIEELRIGRSLVQILCVIVTLGFWSPTTVCWRCCRPHSQQGILR